MYIRKELITPEIAKEMLATNYRNRPLRESVVNDYVRMFRNGEFVEESPNTISINTKGKLIDGQHRLTAIIRLGISVWLYVARDVPDNAVIDRGMMRALQDSLYMRGEISKEYANRQIIAIARFYIMTKKKLGHQKFVKEKDIIELINSNGDSLLNSFALSCKGDSSNSIMRKQCYQAALFAALLNGVSYSTLERFCIVANTGFATDNSESAAILLRNFALKSVIVSKSYALRSEYTKVCECAIRDFNSGVPRKIMYKNPKHVYIKIEGE